MDRSLRRAIFFFALCSRLKNPISLKIPLVLTVSALKP